MKYLAIIFLILGGTIDTAGDLVMKYWVKTNRWYIFIVGLVVYLIGLVFLSLSYKAENIAVASITFVLINIITLVLVSWYYYHENLTHIQLFGIFLGLIAVAVLQMGGK